MMRHEQCLQMPFLVSLLRTAGREPQVATQQQRFSKRPPYCPLTVCLHPRPVPFHKTCWHRGMRKLNALEQTHNG